MGVDVVSFKEGGGKRDRVEAGADGKVGKERGIGGGEKKKKTGGGGGRRGS